METENSCEHKWELRYWMRGYEPVYYWQCEICGEMKPYLKWLTC